MNIETLDKALSIANKIEQLKDMKQRIESGASAKDELKNRFAKTVEMLPGEDVIDAYNEATEEFNRKWAEHLGVQVDQLQSEFDSL